MQHFIINLIDIHHKLLIFYYDIRYLIIRDIIYIIIIYV